MALCHFNSTTSFSVILTVLHFNGFLSLEDIEGKTSEIDMNPKLRRNIK